MIVISAVLVFIAIGLLVAGWVTMTLELVVASVAVSVVSFAVLAVGAFLRRRELFGSGATEATGTSGGTAKANERAKRLQLRRGRPGPTGSQEVGRAAKVPADALVYVLSGRRRYHLKNCRQLAGQEKEELTYEEARGEGFSPCTACMPDSALAARASAVTTEPATGEAVTDEAVTGEAVTDEAVTGEAAAAEIVTDETVRDTTPSDEPVTEVIERVPPQESPEPAEPSETTKQGPAEEAANVAEPGEAEDAAEVAQPGDAEERAEVKPSGDAEEVAANESAAEASEDGIVRVISGTRRYHAGDCAIVKGAGESGVESMPLSEAKEAGYTPCSVCQTEENEDR